MSSARAKVLSRILVVEDEPDIRSLARLALETLGGFQVGVCSSGREALDRVGSFAPDLILMDVMMPALDGPSTLEALRRDPLTAGYAVVFMTASGQAQEVARYREMGALGVIDKPFNLSTLAPSLRSLWEKLHD